MVFARTFDVAFTKLHITMPSYELFYTPNTASLSTHWLLVHLETTYQIPHSIHLIDFSTQSQKSKSYLKLNPKGRVPTLLIDETPYTESAALLQIIGENHPETNLVPLPGTPDRNRFLETMAYVATQLLPAARDYYYAGRDGPDDAGNIKSLAERRIHDTWKLLDRQLEREGEGKGRSYLVGDSLTVLDFLVGATTS